MIEYSRTFLVFFIAIFIPAKAFCELLTHKVDVETKFGTLKAEIHFEDKNKILAERAEDIIRNDLIKVIEYFEYVPMDDVHINIDHYLRLTNGNARGFPTNIINVYNFPANNKEHLIILEDWWKGLILHEFTHITHLDQTRGFFKGLRNVFGTLGKLPVAITPRWFIEGVATWSESTFLKSGRLQNELLNRELTDYFQSEKTCHTLDCLDDPGHYPNGQLAYWAGAHFLNYVEGLKPKTVKCLVETNSDEAPGFLNNTFKLCTGSTVYSLFDDFVQSFIKRYPKNEATKSIIENSFGKTIYQTGILYDQKKLFQYEKNKNASALVSYDLEENISFVQKFEHPISDLSSMLNLDEDTRGILVSFNDDPKFRLRNKIWKILNAETLTIEKTLLFEKDPSFLLALSLNEYIAVTYVNNHYEISKVQFDFNPNSEDPLSIASATILKTKELGDEKNVLALKKIGNKLLFKIHDYTKDDATIVISDLDLNEFSEVYSSKKYFDLFYQGPDSIGIKEGESAFKFIFNENRVLKSKMDFLKYKETVFLEETNDSSLALSDKLILSPLENVRNDQKENLKLTQYELNDFKGPKDNFETQHYPRFELFRPHWWFLSLTNADNLNGYGAMTSFSDPMSIHNFNANLMRFDPIKKFGGKISYNFDQDPYGLDIQYSKTYSKKDVDFDYINESGEFETHFYLKLYQKRFSHTSGLMFGNSVTKDSITSQNVKYIGGQYTLGYKSNDISDWWSRFSLLSRLSIDTPSSNESFLNWQSRLYSQWQLHNRLTFDGRLSYGKLFKSDFSRGVIYGGGITQGTVFRLYDFYGLPYGNAYGNDLMATRFKFDLNALDIYRGNDLFPLFLREFHLILGAEYLKADRIYMNKKYFYDENIQSVFIGPKLQTTLFYWAPLDIELIYSYIKLPDGNTTVPVNLLITAEVF